MMLPFWFAPLFAWAPPRVSHETGRGGTGEATFIGVLEGGLTRSKDSLETPPVQLYHVDGRGLLTALTPADAAAGRWLAIDRASAQPVREIHYYRDRRRIGHPTPHWYHETRRTLIDTHGAVHSPTAQLCDLTGDFICEG